MKTLRTAFLIALVTAMSTAAWATAADQHTHVVMVRPGASLPSDAEIAALGGTVDLRRYDRLVVTIPDATLPLLRKHGGVKYTQRLVVGQMIEAASNPLPAASSEALAPHSEVTPGPPTWSSGPYAYDGAGNITSIGTAGYPGYESYMYDPLSRLTSASLPGHTESYTYDGFGNMTNRITDNQ